MTYCVRRSPLYRGARAEFWRKGTDKNPLHPFTAKVEWVNEDQTAMVTPDDGDEVLVDLRTLTWNLILD